MPRKRTEPRIIFTVGEQLQILQNSDFKCAHCGKRLSIRKESGFTIEHAIPLHKGGTNDMKNLIALCKECNAQKSDDIVRPKQFYPYLPRKKLAELEELFDEYMTGTDWLSGDNLFQYDQFDIPISFPVPKVKQREVILMNGVAHVTKMRPPDAFQWIYAYTAHLSTGDKAIMAKSEEELIWPYYRVTYSDKDILVFGTHVDKPNWKEPEDDSSFAERIRNENKRNSIQIELFVNPELKDNGKLTNVILCSVIQSIHKEIHMTLYNSAPGSLIEFQTHSPHSDKKAIAAYETLTTISKQRYTGYVTRENPDETDGYAQGISATFYQGTGAEMSQMVKSHGYKNIKEMAQSENFATIENEMNALLDKPLSQHTTRPKPVAKPAPHKNHAKKAARSKRKRK